MGVQVIGNRKRKQAIANTGLPLTRLLRASNDIWLGRIDTSAGHIHVRIDPKTWRYWFDNDGGCWTSCADVGERLTVTYDQTPLVLSDAPGYTPHTTDKAN